MNYLFEQKTKVNFLYFLAMKQELLTNESSIIIQ